MGSAMRTLWDDSPAVTRLACAGYPTLSVATLVLVPLAPNVRAALICCLHTVLQQRHIWALFTSFFYRPVRHFPMVFFMLVEVYLCLAYLPERERDLGSFRFLGWVLVTMGAVNLVFLAAMFIWTLLWGAEYWFSCNQGLWPLLMVCITLRSLASPGEPMSVCGFAYVPNRWFPVVVAAVLSVCSGAILWDVAAALAVGYAHGPLQLESLLPSTACAASVERGCLGSCLRWLVSRLGNWVPVHGARGYEDLAGASRRYASEMRRASSARQIGAGSDMPLFRGQAVARSMTSPPSALSAADDAAGAGGHGNPVDRQSSC
mmetsp:Transcript_137899/g.384552  ORF Transcript_137899/g.384552 Transcript_137899/m.384552 type:complete len:318 (-) Transcript_137899:162-1115(-)